MDQHTCLNRTNYTQDCQDKQMKTIPGFPKIKANVFGQIWSFKTEPTGRKLKQRKDKDGYFIVTLNNIPRRVNRLVCMAYHGPPPTLTCHARHLNGDHQDNRPLNLMWGTAKDNYADKKIYGREATGERNSRAKLTEVEVIALRSLHNKFQFNITAVEKAFGLGRCTLNHAITGRTWKYLNDKHTPSWSWQKQ